eukprot:gene20607-27407_t
MTTTASVSLQNPLYFPPFSMLPAAEDLGGSYFQETQQGLVMPARTWAYVGEIVNADLSQLAVLGHRVEVRDVSGDVHSVLFYPVAGKEDLLDNLELQVGSTIFILPDLLDYSELQVGSTIFIRYAQRCYFSDLSTEALKVEDPSFVKLFVSQAYFEQSQYCMCCRTDVSHLGGSALKCDNCGTATFW